MLFSSVTGARMYVDGIVAAACVGKAFPLADELCA